jgi:hypothetical protein
MMSTSLENYDNDVIINLGCDSTRDPRIFVSIAEDNVRSVKEIFFNVSASKVI